jgi:hypothetical protein
MRSNWPAYLHTEAAEVVAAESTTTIAGLMAATLSTRSTPSLVVLPLTPGRLGVYLRRIGLEESG